VDLRLCRDPLRILGTAESNACSVCGAFNAAFTELLWPFVVSLILVVCAMDIHLGVKVKM